MKADERRKFVEYLDSVIKENEAIIHDAKFREIVPGLKMEISAAKLIRDKLSGLEVLEG